MGIKLDVNVTQEGIERNFSKLNSYIEKTNRLIAGQDIRFTEEQIARMKAITEAVEKVTQFIDDRLTYLRLHTADLIQMQKALADAVDQEIRDTITAVETSINAAITEVKTVDIPNMQAATNAAITALDNAKVSHTLFNDTVNELAQADTDSRSLIQQNADSILSVVGTLNQDPGATGQYTAISSLKQRADSITLTVNENKSTADGQISTLSSQITQTAGSVSTVVAELNKDQPGYSSFTKIKQTTDAIIGTVSSNKSDADGKISTLNSQIAAVPGQITAAVTSAKNDLTTKITAVELDVDGLHTTVATNKQDADGKVQTQATRIDQLPGVINLAVTQSPTVSPIPNLANLRLTVDGLSSTVSNQSGNISALEQRANAMDITVASKASAAALQVTDNSISAIVTNLNKPIESSPYASITALQGLIDLCVKDEDYTGAKIVSRLNLSPNGILIDGKLIHVTGDTIFDNDVITSGMLKAGAISADIIYQAGYKVKSCIMTRGQAGDGTYVPLPSGYTIDQCAIMCAGGVPNSSGSGITPNINSIDPMSGMVTSYTYNLGSTRLAGSVYFVVIGVK